MISAKTLWPHLEALIPDLPKHTKKMTITIDVREPVEITATYYPDVLNVQYGDIVQEQATFNLVKINEPAHD